MIFWEFRFRSQKDENMSFASKIYFAWTEKRTYVIAKLDFVDRNIYRIFLLVTFYIETNHQ